MIHFEGQVFFFDLSTSRNAFRVPKADPDFSEGAPLKKLPLAGGRVCVRSHFYPAKLPPIACKSRSTAGIDRRNRYDIMFCYTNFTWISFSSNALFAISYFSILFCIFTEQHWIRKEAVLQAVLS